MSADAVERIANAVLYEGYMLYPYRKSAVKNQQRFNFGVLYPSEYCDLEAGSDNWEMQTECLVLGNAATRLEARIRFLQLIERQDFQEGMERTVCTRACGLRSLEILPLRQSFHFGEIRRPPGTASGATSGRLFQDNSDNPEPH